MNDTAGGCHASETRPASREMLCQMAHASTGVARLSQSSEDSPSAKHLQGVHLQGMCVPALEMKLFLHIPSSLLRSLHFFPKETRSVFPDSGAQSLLQSDAKSGQSNKSAPSAMHSGDSLQSVQAHGMVSESFWM